MAYGWEIVDDVDDGEDWGDPGEHWDYHQDCNEYFWTSDETGHIHCGCGAWRFYDDDEVEEYDDDD